MSELLSHFNIESKYILQITLSLVCGGILGIEREIRKQPAGLRTIILITLGSCLFMILSDMITQNFTSSNYANISIDPTRIASYVIAGIGFLGAGPIIAKHNDVLGLTTAATIWISAGIGLLIGSSEYAMAVLCTMTVFAVLLCLMPISNYLYNLGPWSKLTISCTNTSLASHLAISNIQSHKGVILETRRNKEGLRITFKIRDDAHINCALLNELHNTEGIKFIETNQE